MAKGYIGVRHLDWMEFVWTSSLPSNAKLLAAYLSSYMNKHKDHAFPSLGTIEGETGLGHATVLKYLNVLEKEEFLVRRRGGGRGQDSKYISTAYFVRFPSFLDNCIKQVESRPLSIGNRSADESYQVGSCELAGREPTTNQQVINNNNHTRKIKTTIPEKFQISDRVNQWAKEKGYSNLNEHLENFIFASEAKGYKYVDWDKAFMNAIRNNWAKVEVAQDQFEDCIT